MTDKIQIIVADDHPLLRGGVVLSLQEHGHFDVQAQVGTAAEAVAAVEAHLPDVALLDISMPGSGLNAAAEIARRFPAVGIVMLTVSESDDDLMAALKAGARGYVLKGVSAPQLIEVLQSVADGASYVSPSLAARVLATMQARPAPDVQAVSEDLTQREATILRLVATGLSNKEIARELDLQEKTIKHYMTNILQKLQVRNRVEAALKARDMGL
ncbi:response regulator transcription factor [Paracoccus sp. CPCC 101403]|uniref:Response regulator transcription factor n=2 Tax=Paracoccus broussonetiae TaxID=3075834 RepID=A0ABU3E927_9RHOB|nr:response regulator transcription factor [Paracoccus sp. CPCC 101403]MDT1060719.1 response regulator transcription factor [Paracoccus sp. CPCC 101403]